MFSGHYAVRGHDYPLAYARSVSTVDFYTPVSQGYSASGKIPLRSLLLEPIASKQEILNLAANRDICLESVAVYDKRPC